ncbi:unnamed protein product [Ilex paraguariensis]|uniref:DYW domain-containing protein n=1 Tax=Ilex paraguariensis TaxID=185542 RepID=A0ABC8TIX0_9AQUA
MIQAYSKTPTSQESLYLFQQMLFLDGSTFANPDKYTFNFVITACSCESTFFGYGQNVHAMVLKNGYDSNLFVGNSLVNLYASLSRMVNGQRVFDEMPYRDIITWTSLVRGYTMCGDIVKAEELFLKMPEKNDVSWAVMVAGYVVRELYSNALTCFNDMLGDDKVRPNEAVFVSVLSACAHLGALDQGKWIHVFMDKTGTLESPNISTALIDMYAKCGRIDCAKQVFDGIGKRDLHTWTSMISGLSMHGLGKEALEVFSDMLGEGVKPDNITILGVLNACSHSGRVEEGLSIFYDLERLWGIVPKLEHYGCLIDLLSRAGRLESAFEAVKSMPMEPDIVIWRALLSACRVHGNVGLGERIIKYIAQLNPGSHGGGYVLLSNLYASMGQWDSVIKVRKAMSQKEIKSSPGCSYIEIDGAVHEFLAADRLHPKILEINNKLNEVMKRISLEGGYLPITNQVLFDLSEEEKEQAISWHSEKLAVAFGLMSTVEGTPIRVFKNLRICEDCHSAMKAISQVFEREIVVRDRSRFHTFIAGKCSCTDFW